MGLAWQQGPLGGKAVGTRSRTSPVADVRAGALEPEARTTNHRDLGATAWFSVRAGDTQEKHAAWQHADLPAYAAVLRDRVAFARHLVVRDGDRVVADTHRPLVLYESGFAPRWYTDAPRGHTGTRRGRDRGRCHGAQRFGPTSSTSTSTAASSPSNR